jgi:hypothetical protein
MRLDLRHQIVERLIGIHGPGTACEREIAELRRSDREVKRDRRDRQTQQRQNGRGAAQSDIRPRREIVPTVRRRKQPAADLDTRGFRFRTTDQASGDVAINLGELIAVDGSLAAAGVRRRAAAQRPEHGKDRRHRHQREHKPQRHQVVPGRNDAFKTSADAPLYTTGGKPGN